MSEIGYDPNDAQASVVDGKISIDRQIDRIPFLSKYHQPIGMILIILFSVVILFFMSQPFILLYKQSVTNSYPSVPAVVEGSSVVHNRKANGGYSFTRVDLRCTYEVEGQTYEATVRGYEKKLSKGSVITIHYDPRRPSDYYYGPYVYQILTAAASAAAVFFVLGAVMIFIIRYMKFGHIQTTEEYMDNNYRHEQTRQSGILPPHEKHTEPLFDYYQSPDETDSDPYSS